jgi:hypothetical protein
VKKPDPVGPADRACLALAQALSCRTQPLRLERRPFAGGFACMEGKERISVLIDLASDHPIKLPSGWIVRRLGPQRMWPINPTRIVIELERKGVA